MSLIFLGDTAIPFKSRKKTEITSWGDKSVILKLEGSIVYNTNKYSKKREVYNGPAVAEYLDNLGVCAVSLANNHMFDIHHSPKPTIRALSSHGIQTYGAGRNLKEAQQPAIIEDEGQRVIILGFGWSVIGCQIASAKYPGVNPLQPWSVFESIKHLNNKFPDARLILHMHWNYELELYPQPMHRQLAFRAIDLGADAVVGSHSHRVQGIELYRGAPVVYDLGNWMFVQNEYHDGEIEYPECASIQLGFEWSPKSDEMICHWFRYNEKTNKVVHLKKENLTSSEYIDGLTPYTGMSHSRYIEFFKRKRIKKKALPIYYDIDDNIKNKIRNYWVKIRGSIIKLIDTLSLKNTQRSA